MPANDKSGKSKGNELERKSDPTHKLDMAVRMDRPGRPSAKEPKQDRKLTPGEAGRKKEEIKIGDKSFSHETEKSPAVQARITKSATVAGKLRKRLKTKASRLEAATHDLPIRSPEQQALVLKHIAENKTKTEKDHKGRVVPKHEPYKEHHLSAEVRKQYDALYEPDKKYVLDAFGHKNRQLARKAHKVDHEAWVKTKGHLRGEKEPQLHDYLKTNQGIRTLPAVERDANGNAKRTTHTYKDKNTGETKTTHRFVYKKDKHGGQEYTEHFEHRAEGAKTHPVFNPTVKDLHREVASYRNYKPLGSSNKKIVKRGSEQRLESSGPGTSDIAESDHVSKLKQLRKEHRDTIGHLSLALKSASTPAMTRRKLASALLRSKKLVAKHKAELEAIPTGKITDEKGKTTTYDQRLRSKKLEHSQILGSLSKKIEAYKHSQTLKTPKDRNRARSVLRTTRTKRDELTKQIKRSAVSEEQKLNAERRTAQHDVKAFEPHGESHGVSPLEDREAIKKHYITAAVHARVKSHPAYKEAAKAITDIKKRHAKSKINSAALNSSQHLYGGKSVYHRLVADQIRKMHTAEIAHPRALLQTRADDLAKEKEVLKRGVRTSAVSIVKGKKDNEGNYTRETRYVTKPVTAEERASYRKAATDHKENIRKFNEKVRHFNRNYAPTYKEHRALQAKSEAHDTARVKAETKRIADKREADKAARAAKREANKKAGVVNPNERGLKKGITTPSKKELDKKKPKQLPTKKKALGAPKKKLVDNTAAFLRGIKKSKIGSRSHTTARRKR